MTNCLETFIKRFQFLFCDFVKFLYLMDRNEEFDPDLKDEHVMS